MFAWQLRKKYRTCLPHYLHRHLSPSKDWRCLVQSLISRRERCHHPGSRTGEKTRLFTMEEETTKNIPAPVERYLGPNISLVVGTRSDPGIKRQHKPNEDSLFAARGE